MAINDALPLERPHVAMTLPNKVSVVHQRSRLGMISGGGGIIS